MTSGVSGSGGTGGIPPFQSPGSKKPSRKGGLGDHEISDSESVSSSSSSSSSRSGGIKEAVGGAARKAIGAAKKAGGNFARGVKSLGARIKTGLGRSASEGDIHGHGSSEASEGAGVSRSFSEGDIPGVASGDRGHRARVAEKLRRLKEKVSATGKTIYLGFSGKKEKAQASKTTWYVDLGAGSASPKGASRGYDPVKLPERVVEDLRAFFQTGGLRSSSSSSSSSTEDLSDSLMEQAEALMELGGGSGLEVSEGPRGERVVYAQLAIDAGKKAAKTSSKTEKEWKSGRSRLEKVAKDARKAIDKFDRGLKKLTRDLARIFSKGGEGALGPQEDFVVRYDAKTKTVTLEKASVGEEVEYAEIIFKDKETASKISGPITAKVVTSKPGLGSYVEERLTTAVRGRATPLTSKDSLGKLTTATVSMQAVVSTQKKVLEATEHTLEALGQRGAPRTERQAKREMDAQDKVMSELEKQTKEMLSRVQGRNWKQFDRGMKKS
ncbi:hypothetical protein [Chlamydiifrater volucris]|uniref:hypothetical protein n=1 Tax=Chlamydiifrater volucris TaxID=2681470 RepID=UPI0032B16AB7